VGKRLQVEVHREHSAAEQIIQENLANLAAEHGLALVTSEEGFDFVPIDEEPQQPSAPAKTQSHKKGRSQASKSKPSTGSNPPSDQSQVETSDVKESQLEQEQGEVRIRRQHLAAIEKLRPHIEEAHRQIALQEAESSTRLVQRQREAL